MISPLRPARQVRRPGRRPPLPRRIRSRPDRRLAVRVRTTDRLDLPIDQAAARHDEWEYGRLGRMTRKDDPRGQSYDTTYSYDELNRPTGVSATALDASISMAYDALGRRTSLSDATGSTSFTYDPLGRTTVITAPLTGAIGYDYNARGQRTQLTYPDSSTIDYSYWDDGQLKAVLQGSTTLASYAYDAVGRLDTLTRANGAVTDHNYDDADRLTELTTTVGSVDVSQFSYTLDRLGLRVGVEETLPARCDAGFTLAWSGVDTFDTVTTTVSVPVESYVAILSGAGGVLQVRDSYGRITELYGSGARYDFEFGESNGAIQLHALGSASIVFSVIICVPGSPSAPPPPPMRTIAYNYDGLNRLLGASESPGAVYTYTFDLAGNRLSAWENSVQVQSRSYNAANQVVGWSYDAAGNLLSNGTTTSTYDALSRLTSQGGASYAYNGDGVLVRQATGGITTTYTQDLVAPLSQVLNDGTASYVYGNGPERLRALNGPWYLGDALGSVRATLGDAGAAIATTSYDPWGVPQGSMIAPFGFTGELQNAASGLVHLRARWYDTGEGRFHVRDPFAGWPEQPYSTHYYQYAYSNSVLNIDPSGNCVIELRYHLAAPYAYHADIVLIDDCCERSFGSKKVFGYPSAGGPSANSSQPSQSSGQSSSSAGGSTSQGSGSNSNSSNSSSPGSGPGGPGENTGPWGALWGNFGNFSDINGNTDPALDTRPRDVVLDNDEPCDRYYAAMVRYVFKVRRAQIPYNPLTTNSNALATGALWEVGLEPPRSPIVWTPALGYNLFEHNKNEPPKECPAPSRPGGSQQAC